jgi:arabinofuranosyltransferase
MVLVLARVVFWRLLPTAYEDAYITFRYAAQLVAGHGLVYNVGERVMGFTSPLWTLWTALGVWMVRDPVGWTRVWSIVADAVTLVLTASLLQRHASRAAARCFAAFFAMWPFFAATCVSGLEMSAMLAALALATWLIMRRSRWAGPALGALALMRPEGVVCAFILSIWADGRGRWIGGGVTLAGWTALALYYGSPIPQSLVAKATLYGTPGPWAGRFWWEWLSPAELGRWPATQEGLQLFFLRVLLAPAVVVGAWRLRRAPLLMLPAAAVAVWLGYALLGVAYFNWYMLVPLAGLVLLASAGLPEILRGRAVYVSLALFLAGAWTTQPEKIYFSRALEEAEQFGGCADYLEAHAIPGQSMLLEPIGILGYRLRGLRVIDEIGLVSPAVAERRRRGPGWYSDVARAERPDWLVVRYGVLMDRSAFAGRGSPFRDQADQNQSLADFHVVHVTRKPPSQTDFVVLARQP